MTKLTREAREAAYIVAVCLILAVASIVGGVSRSDAAVKPKDPKISEALKRAVTVPKLKSIAFHFTCNGRPVVIHTGSAVQTQLTMQFVLGRISPMEWAARMAGHMPRHMALLFKIAQACQHKGPKA